MLLGRAVVEDPRARRAASALAAEGYDVNVLELAPVRRRERTQDRFTRRSALAPAWLDRALPPYAGFLAGAVRVRPDVVHAHEAATLLPGLVGARLTGARLVYDAREPPAETVRARCARAVERLAVPRAALVLAPSDGIAACLRDRHGLPGTPVVVRDVSALVEGTSTGTPGLRERLGIDTHTPLVLHQGAVAMRGATTLVRAVAAIDGAHLVFLGGEDARGVDGELVRLAVELGMAEHVHFLASPPPERLLALTREADVGVTLLDDTRASRLALPAPLFQYIAAGIAVVASDLPEIGALVRDRRIGWTVDPADPEAVAGALRVALAADGLEPLRTYRRRAAAELRWPVERRRLLDAYAQLAARMGFATGGQAS